jgi:hypothetical protein
MSLSTWLLIGVIIVLLVIVAVLGLIASLAADFVGGLTEGFKGRFK